MLWEAFCVYILFYYCDICGIMLRHVCPSAAGVEETESKLCLCVYCVYMINSSSAHESIDHNGLLCGKA